jgi:hypothetical protein
MTFNSEQEFIVVPKYPYRPWIHEIDVLDKARYRKELRELSKKRYDVVNFTTAVDLDAKGKLRIENKVRVIYIVDIDDPFVQTALSMAELNQEYGIPCTFNPRFYHFKDEELSMMINKISRLHDQEIGYQYEEVADCKSDISDARKVFRRHLKYLNTQHKIETLMAHGRSGEGYRTADLFKNQGRYKPELWKKYGLRAKADFYYFLENIQGGVYYFNESTRFQAEEYIETLKCFKPNDVVIMLHHSEYLHIGIKFRPNPVVYKGLDGVKHIFSGRS